MDRARDPAGREKDSEDDRLVNPPWETETGRLGSVRTASAED
jgi:hypothetical protein